MRIHRFQHFELDRELFKLTKHGSPVSIGRRSFDLLSYLIENYERVVPIDELVSEVWGSKAISPSAIPTCMMELRRLLSGGGDAHPVIRTVKGRGYQFSAELLSPGSANLFTVEHPEELSFAGRAHELLTLRQAHNSVRQYRKSHTRLIRGDAGIGKTRLLQEFLRQIPSTTLAFVFTCPEIDGAPAFLPFLELRPEMNRIAKRQESDPEYSRSSTIGYPNRPPSKPTLNGRFAFFKEWSSICRELCQQAPVILALEDVHRTDADTIELFDWLGTDLSDQPLMLVATTRSVYRGKDIQRPIEKIEARKDSSTLDLPLLDETSIETMLRGRTPSPRVVAKAIYRRTAGHPFFAKHIAESIQSFTDETDIEDAMDLIPPTMAGLLAHQLLDLPEATRGVLTAGAVLGKEFSIETCAAMSRVSVESAVEDLSAAITAGLISESNDISTRVRFSHMIFRDALYDALTVHERKRLHARAAETMIALSNGDSRDLDGVIAEHLERALPLSDPAKAVRYRRAAGQSHLQKFAFKEAKSSLARAREIPGGDAVLSVEDRCNLRFELAEAQLYSLDRPASRSTLFDAASIARDARSPTLLAEAAIRISPDSLAIEVGPYDSDHASLLTEALKELPRCELALRSRVMACLSHVLAWSEDSEKSPQLAQNALQLAHQTKDAETISAALAACADALHGPDRIDERVHTIGLLKASLHEAGDQRCRLMQRIRNAGAMLDAGEIRQLDTEISAIEFSSRGMNAPHFAWFPIAFRAMRSMMKGDLSYATELGNLFSKVGSNTGDINVAAARACQYCCISLELDRTAESIPLASQFTSQFPGVQAWVAGLAMLDLHAGNIRRAIETLDTFDVTSINNLFHEPGGSAGVAFLAEIAVESGNKTKMSQIYKLCCAAGTRSATLGYAITYFGCYSRYAGILASALGLPTEAVEHLRLAVATEASRGATLWRVHAQLDLAEELLAQRAPSDEIRKICDDAVDEATDRGLFRVSRRASDIRSTLDIRERIL